MKFFEKFIAAAALVVSVAAVAIPSPQGAGADGPNMFTQPAAGGTTLNGEGVVNIAWTPGPPGTVSLWLTKGKEGAMIDLIPVVAGIPNTGAYTWTPPTDLQDSSTITNGEQYGFRIVDDSSQATNYSPPFGLVIPGSTYKAPGAEEPAPPVESTPTAATEPTSTSAAPETTAPETTAPAESAAPTAAPTTVENSPATTSGATTPTKTSTSEPEKTDEPSKDSGSNGPNIGLIIGAIFGAVAGIGLISVALIIFLKKRKEQQRENALKNIDRQHALQRVSEAHREWMGQYEEEGKGPQRAPSNGGLSVGGRTEKGRRASSFLGTAF